MKTVSKNLKAALCVAAGVLAVSPALAKVTLPDQIGDNMVLQQQSQARLWGWADAGKTIKVTVSWSDKVFATKAGQSGRWELPVETPAASFDPQTLTVSDGEPVELKNILIGEVWFASGQSNMEMPVRGFWNCPIEDSNQTITTAADYRRSIRFATLAHPEKYTVQERVEGSWKECTPENLQNFSATAFFFAQNLTRVLNVPVGIINSAWGGSRVEGWMPADSLKAWGEPYTEEEIRKQYPNQQYMYAEIMYNGVLAPVIGYTIKGFIWYQGESNVGHHQEYTGRFARMISMWRKLWKQGDPPFYYAEIAPYDYGYDPQGALLREAQFRTQAVVPNTGMISTNDLVEPFELKQIHPKNKKDVGRRLSYLALQQTYGVPGIESHGPEYKSMEVKDGKAYLTFNHAEEGFSRLQDIEGFEICGADRNFVSAEVSIDPSDQRVLVVSSKEVAEPVAVRYAFHNFQIGNLAGIRGLPVVPFRTDNFE